MAHAHNHDHDFHHEQGSELSEMQLRTRAIETILLEKGYREQAAIDELIETYEKKIGPRNGAQVVAKAWVDPKFRKWLLEDGTAAIGSPPARCCARAHRPVRGERPSQRD